MAIKTPPHGVAHMAIRFMRRLALDEDGDWRERQVLLDAAAILEVWRPRERCLVCGQRLVGRGEVQRRHSDMKTCSSACRQKLHRSRRRATAWA